MPRIPLIEDLTTQPVPAGSNVLVEYDPASQWYNASITIAAGWLRSGGKVLYGAMAQEPEKIRSQLNRLGLLPEAVEKEDRLRIWDWYTVTLGQKSKEKLALESLKVPDLSIWFSKEIMRQPPDPNVLRIFDSISTVARFNDERSWVEFLLSRAIPVASLQKSTTIRGLMRGVQSEWAYMQLEGASDGIIDFKLGEVGKVTQDLIRIRAMRNVPFDREWHQLKIAENFEVTLET